MHKILPFAFWIFSYLACEATLTHQPTDKKQPLDGSISLSDGITPASSDGGLQIAPQPTQPEPQDYLCKPCEVHENCGGVGNYCITNPNTHESICAKDCSGEKVCPLTHSCISIANPEGGTAKQCVPNTGTCKDLPNIQPIPAGTCGNDMETQVWKLVNEIRKSNSLKELQCDAATAYAARKFSQYMCDAGFFDHIGPDGKTPGQRLAEAGVIWTPPGGENICMNASSAKAAVNGWMNSPKHRANILNSLYTHIGIGYVNCTKPHSSYWTQDFIRK